MTDVCISFKKYYSLFSFYSHAPKNMHHRDTSKQLEISGLLHPQSSIMQIIILVSTSECREKLKKTEMFKTLYGTKPLAFMHSETTVLLLKVNVEHQTNKKFIRDQASLKSQ